MINTLLKIAALVAFAIGIYYGWYDEYAKGAYFIGIAIMNKLSSMGD